MNKDISIQDWGLIPYKDAWDKQEALFAETVAIKLENRKSLESGVWGFESGVWSLESQCQPTPGLPTPDSQPPTLNSGLPTPDSQPPTLNSGLQTPDSRLQTPNFLIFCQHPHVYTLGKSGDKANLLIPDSVMKEKEISYFPINRGGDITYHGPGQLVGYLIFDLDNFFTDIHKFLRYMEEAIILTLAEFNIVAGRIAGLTGVWLDVDNPAKSRKICAMGIRASRWVTMHGFALNVNTDLSYFSYINPCGITDKAVTSMQKELGQVVDIQVVQQKLGGNILRLFQ